MIQTKVVDYQEGNARLEGFAAYDSKKSGKRPVVLIAHAWRGRDDFVEEKARELAELGYVGFAMDVYGKGILGNNPEENSRLMQPLMQDRQMLRRRLLAGMETAKKLAEVDAQQVAAIGFCFGGLCVLDMARSGADLKGVVSFHGLLQPAEIPNKKIQAKVLALHGHDDPMVPPDVVLQFETEMTQAKVDWQVHVFGNTKHAFTNPVANDAKLGLLYNPVANQRAQLMMQNFLQEIFSA